MAEIIPEVSSPKYPVTELSDSIWWRETFAEFGLQRSVMLIGWSALLGASLREGEKLEQARDRLIKMGMPRATTYKAVQELRQLLRRLEVAYEKEKLGDLPPENQFIRTFGSLQISR